MIITGTIVNVATVTIGSTLGLILGNRIKEKYKVVVFQGLGLFTLFLGVQMALKTSNPILMVFSLLLGGLCGELLRLEERFLSFGDKLRKRIRIADARFSEGLVTAFMIFCVGSMTILGAIEEGLGNPPRLLYTKSLMDGFSSIALASVMGSGVLFAAIPLFFFQGGLTLMAMVGGNFMPEPVMQELIATGGILLLGLGINLLDMKHIKVINLLPSLLFIVIISWLYVIFLN